MNKNIKLNKGVAHFRDKKGQETVEFIAKKSNAEIDKIMANRDGTAFITGGKAHRDNVKQEQLARQKSYPEILKKQTESVKRAISEYTHDVSIVLNQIKRQNAGNAKLISDVDNLLQLVENLRVQGLNTNGSTFYQLEKQLKGVNGSMNIMHGEILNLKSNYVLNLNQQTVNDLNQKFDTIRDSLVNFHKAEKQHAKASDTAQLVLSSVTKLFRAPASEVAQRNPAIVGYFNAKTTHAAASTPNSPANSAQLETGIPKTPGAKSETVKETEPVQPKNEGTRKGNKA